MPRVRTESLQEGMTVVNDVKNVDGMLLIPSGCVLTERHLNVLSAWGVNDVEVAAGEDAGEAADSLAQLDPEVLARLTAELRALFWRLDESNPAAMEVFHLMLRRRVNARPPGNA